MSNFETRKFETEAHSEELDFMFNQDSADFDKLEQGNIDFVYAAKVYFRLARKRITAALKERMKKNFTNVLSVRHFQMVLCEKIRLLNILSR